MDVVGCGTFCGPDKTNGDRVWTTATGKRKSAITKSMYAAMVHTILTTTFTTCGRHAGSERSENGSHWNQNLGGAQTFG